MFIRFVFVLVAIVSVLFASPAWPPGVALDWTVLSTTPNVRFTLDKKVWASVETGMKIPNKSWVDTGPRGGLPFIVVLIRSICHPAPLPAYSICRARPKRPWLSSSQAQFH